MNSRPHSARPGADKPLLVLDLDETLVHASEKLLGRPPDFTLPPYYGYFRPGLHWFLQTVSEHYRLAVWTSSSPDYARAISSLVFADVAALEFVWARDRCTLQRDLVLDTWTLAKRLKKLKNIGFDLTRVVMVDDSPEKHTRNYGNLVVVVAFLGDPHDRELAGLAPYLVELATASDVRRVEKRTWARRMLAAPGR